MDDSRKGREDDDVEAGRSADSEISEEALEEREERVWVAVPSKPTYASKGTGTSDYHIPRRHKKKVRPLPPVKKIPMTPETSMDSMDAYHPSSQHSTDKSEDKPRKSASISDEVVIRKDTYSRHTIIDERRKDSQEEKKSVRYSGVSVEEKGSIFRSSSHGWRASTESLRLETEGWVAGVCTITFRLPRDLANLKFFF